MKLRPYQEVGRDFLAARRHALLADEMRVGKTPQAILAAQKVGAESIIVVCPAIAVEHWKREFLKWGSAFVGTVVSFDRFRIDSSKYLSNTYWDLAIVDEAHFARNPQAQRTQLIYGKDGLGWHADRLWALSGTPAPRHAGELYPMLKAFGATPLSYSQFTYKFCTWTWDKKIKGTNVAKIPELRKMLEPFMLRRKRADVAPDMPEIDFQFLEVEPDSAKGCPRHSDDLILKDEELAQWAERHWDAEDRVEVARAKVLSLVEHIVFALENKLLKQTVVFGWHKEPLDTLLSCLLTHGIVVAAITGSTPAKARQDIQEEFRNGSIQVVVANILAAGTAIDLSAASHGYFLELDWLGVNNLQAANRLVSMDKQEKVTFDIATWPGSTDDRVQRVLVRRMSEIKAMGLA